MKINRHGRAKVLTQYQIQLIFSHGLDNDRDSESLLLSADRYTCSTTAAKISHQNLLPEIESIQDVSVLKTILEGIDTSSTVSQLRQIYQLPTTDTQSEV